MDSTLTRRLSAAGAIATIVALLAAAAPSALGAGYPRPRGASPYRTSLVPVYERCPRPGVSANTTHGAPLAHPACKPPELISGTLTLGTPDTNGKAANSVGSFVMAAKPGLPSNPEDDADVKVGLNLTDVRLQDGLGDYTGELELVLDSRMTDMASGPGQDQPGTLEDFSWTAAVPCAATADTTIGGTCSLQTTVDTLVPGTIKEGKRTIWEEADHIHVLDGGADWLAATEDDNLLFSVQGYFVP